MTSTPRGLLTPFQRDRKRDFASGTSAELLRSKVQQVLMSAGTPWRAEFGADLGRLRHQRNDAALRELARVYVRDALRRWLPSVEVMRLTSESRDNTLLLRLRVRERGLEADVEVSL